MTNIEILEQELKLAQEKKKSILWEIFYIQERGKVLQMEKNQVESLIKTKTDEITTLKTNK